MRKNNIQTTLRGFTLIELLVVIAIIGIVSSIVYTSLSAARAKGRDAQRAEAVKTLKSVLEVYRNTYGKYPEASTADGVGTTITTLSSKLITENNNNYMMEIPQDPKYKNTGNDYQYVRGPATAYGIRVTLENPSETIPVGVNNWCVSGVNINSGWWNGATSPPAALPQCPF